MPSKASQSNVRQRTDQIDVFTTETSCVAIGCRHHPGHPLAQNLSVTLLKADAHSSESSQPERVVREEVFFAKSRSATAMAGLAFLSHCFCRDREVSLFFRKKLNREAAPGDSALHSPPCFSMACSPSFRDPNQRQRFTASVFSGILRVHVCPLGQLGLQKKEQGMVQC